MPSLDQRVVCNRASKMRVQLIESGERKSKCSAIEFATAESGATLDLDVWKRYQASQARPGPLASRRRYKTLLGQLA